MRKRNKIEKSARTLKSFADAKNVQQSRIDLRPITGVALQVGKLLAVVYQVHPGDNRRHIFKGKSAPLLIASADGKKLGIVGGRFKFGARGIVDI